MDYEELNAARRASWLIRNASGLKFNVLNGLVIGIIILIMIAAVGSIF